MKSFVLVTVCSLMAVCNAFNERRPAEEAFGEQREDNLKDPNNEVQFVDVKMDDGKNGVQSSIDMNIIA